MRKKPKDKPKRPLSAYNYFFKSERQRILKYLLRNPEDTFDEAVVDEEEEKRLWTGTKKVSFEEMGKLIGRRWKSMGAEEMEKYTTLAASDAERYKKELKVWNDKKEEEKKQAVADMYSKSSQMNPYQSGYPPPPSGGYHYDPSVASGGMYGASGRSGYPYQDPNASGGYNQQMGMGSYPYYPYQTPKTDQAPGSSSYNYTPPGGTGMNPPDSNGYNPYGAPGGSNSSPPSGMPYNNGSSMASSGSEYPGAPPTSSGPDSQGQPPNYYNQGSQYYGNSFQGYPNGNSGQQHWG